MKMDFINYSSGGLDFSFDEYYAYKDFVDQGGIVVAAAGNNKADLDRTPYYPASYSFLHKFLVFNPVSNETKFTIWKA
jgi:subtilisin family serine protease